MLSLIEIELKSNVTWDLGTEREVGERKSTNQNMKKEINSCLVANPIYISIFIYNMYTLCVYNFGLLIFQI